MDCGRSTARSARKLNRLASSPPVQCYPSRSLQLKRKTLVGAGRKHQGLTRCARPETLTASTPAFSAEKVAARSDSPKRLSLKAKSKSRGHKVPSSEIHEP